MPPPQELTGLDADTRADRRRWRQFTMDHLRLEGVKALRHFRSPENIETLKSLLDDPAWWNVGGADPAEPAQREYFIRREALDILTEWGVDATEPVLREPREDPRGPPPASE